MDDKKIKDQIELDSAVKTGHENPQDADDEAKWDELFKTTQPQLSAAAERARQEINQGLSQPLNLDDL